MDKENVLDNEESLDIDTLSLENNTNLEKTFIEEVDNSADVSSESIEEVEVIEENSNFVGEEPMVQDEKNVQPEVSSEDVDEKEEKGNLAFMLIFMTIILVIIIILPYVFGYK